jgi:hypothetical protein
MSVGTVTARKGESMDFGKLLTEQGVSAPVEPRELYESLARKGERVWVYPRCAGTGARSLACAAR